MRVSEIFTMGGGCDYGCDHGCDYGYYGGYYPDYGRWSYHYYKSYGYYDGHHGVEWCAELERGG